MGQLQSPVDLLKIWALAGGRPLDPRARMLYLYPQHEGVLDESKDGVPAAAGAPFLLPFMKKIECGMAALSHCLLYQISFIDRAVYFPDGVS